MKFKNALLSCMMLIGMSAQAQEAKTVYEFQPHWNVFVQPVGVQHTLGEVSFSDLLSYNVQAGAGYQFSPVFGARFSVNAWQSKAGWDTVKNLQQTWKWNYVAPMVDLTVNLSNVICGYNPNRLFSLGFFAGVGANVAWGNDEAADAKAAIGNYYDGYSDQNLAYLWDGTKARISGRAGLTGDFRISDKVSVGVELQATTLNDHYNSKKAGNADWHFNALAGVKINLGKTHTKKVVPPAEPEIRYVDRVVEKVVEKIVEKPVPTEAKKAEPLRRDIFFTINATHIVKEEMVKVEEIADYMKANPNATVTITGYADKGTGNATINKKLSVTRAKVVVDALVNKFGISQSRIKSDSKGDTEQPFEKGELNRVSICIAQ